MPKAKVERVLNDDGTTKTVEVEVGERGVTKTARYSVPSSASVFQDLILGMKNEPDAGVFIASVSGDEPNADETETPLAFAYRMYVTSIDRRARAAVYESIAAESTLITVGKDKVDIMGFPLLKLIKAANGFMAQVDVRTMAGAPGADESTPEGRAKLQSAREAAEKSIGFGPWRTAIKHLTEGYEKDGARVAPVARMDDALGLVPLA